MSNEFVREERYIVFKVSDLGNSLKGDEIRRLAREYAEHRQRLRKKPLECVVVEKDWPEYEPTWKAIEARVTGAQPAPSVSDDVVEQAVNRFLSWKLPKDFHPDGGMVFIPTKGRGYDSSYWPVGTNLLNAQQAREMLRYVLAAAARGQTMTRDDIIRMAREAGIDAWWDSGNECREDLQAHLEHFSGLIAAAEREACVAICEHGWKTGIGEKHQGDVFATAIRTRGNQ